MILKSKIIAIAVSTLLLISSASTFAELIFADDFDDFELGVWNGQGDVTQAQQGCVISYQGFFRANDYRLAAQMNSPAPSPASPFQLFNTLDPTIAIPFTVELRDLFTNQQQTLTPNIFSNDMSYQIGTCTFLGNSAEMRFNLLATDLYQAPAGDYSVSMDVEARRVNNGGNITGQSDTQYNLRGRIRIPSLIQISGLGDINLGTYDGVSPSLSHNESFCIYANTSHFSMTASSSNGNGNSGTFRLSNGSDTIDYLVKANNTASAQNGMAMLDGASTGALSANQSIPLSRNCNIDGDNAAVFIEVQGTELSAVPAGNYTDVVTLRVAPI